MRTIYCIGEALIDLIDGVPFVGGAPANVAACVAKLGGRSAFLGKLSSDEYGKYIFSELSSLGVDLSHAPIGNEKTAVAQVRLVDGERHFLFCRDGTADLALCADEIDTNLFGEGDALHFCSVCLVESAAKYAHIAALEAAKNAGVTISYDVNLRPSLWQNEDEMLRTAKDFMKYADILKMSEEEFCAFGYKKVQEIFDFSPNIKLLLLTRGANGAAAYSSDGKCLSCPSLNARPLDTVGAGDCFMGAALTALMAKRDVAEAVKFASCAAAISVSGHGAIPSYPTLQEVKRLMTQLKPEICECPSRLL